MVGYVIVEERSPPQGGFLVWYNTLMNRRPLTAWESQKLSMQRHEKNWIQSIKTRKQVRDKDGKPIVIHQNAAGHWEPMATQPRALWDKPKQR